MLLQHMIDKCEQSSRKKKQKNLLESAVAEVLVYEFLVVDFLYLKCCIVNSWKHVASSCLRLWKFLCLYFWWLISESKCCTMNMGTYKCFMFTHFCLLDIGYVFQDLARLKEEEADDSGDLDQTVEYDDGLPQVDSTIAGRCFPHIFSVCLSVCLSVCMSACLSVFVSLKLCLLLTVFVSFSLSLSLCHCLSLCLSLFFSL